MKQPLQAIKSALVNGLVIVLPAWLALLLLLICLLFPSTLSAQEKPGIETTEQPATLTVWQRDIAVFRVSIASLTPEARRDSALQRISDLPKSALYDTLRMEKISLGGIHGVSFLSGKRFLFTLIEEDADQDNGVTFDETADEVLKNLEVLRRARLDQRSLPLILRGAGISLIATLLLAAFLWGLMRLSRIIRRYFIRRATKIRQLKRNELDLRPAFLQISRRITGFILSAIGLTAAYIWITAVLAQFPYTAAWADVLGHNVAIVGGTLLSGALSSLPDLITVIVLFFLTRGTVRLADQILRSLESSTDENEILARDTARATRRIASVLIWIFGLVIAYPYIPGSDSEAFKGISVLAGLMISLGSTGLVNQIMSGFVVLYSGAVRTGEFARVGDVEGTITEIGLLSTKVLTSKNEFVTVPNAVLISKDTINYSRMAGACRTELATNVTIGYDTPWRQVHELLLLAAERTSGIRETPEPNVIQTALSDFYVEYSLRFVPANITRKGAILSALHQQIQDAFAQAGVQIMSPNFVAQPEHPVLPVTPKATGG
ncbi:MAG: mechanosensitive ion channel family protein [Akkermansiaceae bacterium]|nr:mechanosensitive ion channel family protein [Akkermansiaceae bacterium]